MEARSACLFLAFAGAYAVFGRQRDLPVLAGLVTLVIYQTSPMFVAIKGAVGTIYVCDLLLPVLALKALRYRTVRQSDLDRMSLVSAGDSCRCRHAKWYSGRQFGFPRLYRHRYLVLSKC